MNQPPSEVIVTQLSAVSRQLWLEIVSMVFNAGPLEESVTANSLTVNSSGKSSSILATEQTPHSASLRQDDWLQDGALPEMPVRMVIADLREVPIGVAVHLNPSIAACGKVLTDPSLNIPLHPMAPPP
ncbi:hypothetical protein [Synechococcus sp. GFB01]|uniref:hypothetical protein n=1 Tax=Synechococcus sp. GFB01 TaxID=1662190 RepID=UPI000AB39712|nr:hypothetical protein [Synechococcus sp. GFB01]